VRRFRSWCNQDFRARSGRYDRFIALERFNCRSLASPGRTMGTAQTLMLPLAHYRPLYWPPSTSKV
jgi:hypothetical protein